MKYSLHRVNLRIYHRIVLYLFLILEIAIGSALLFYSYSHFIDDKKDFDKTNRYIEASTSAITANPNKTKNLTYDDYLYLKENIFKNTQTSYTVNTSLNFGINNDSFSIALIFIGPEELKETFGIDQEPGKAYIGKTAKKNIQKIVGLEKKIPHFEVDSNSVAYLPKEGYYYELNDMDVDFTKSSIKFPNLDTELEFVDMPEDTKDITIATGSEIQLESYRVSRDRCRPIQPEGRFMIIVPAEYARDIDKIIRPWKHPTLSLIYTTIDPRIVVKNFKESPEEIWQAIDYLKSKHSEANFNLDDPRAINKDLIKKKRQSMYKYMLTSILLLSTVSLITSGIFLLLLQSRKKEIAISLACGSTIKTQIKELILEIGLLILYGMIVGVAIAYMYGDIVEQISIAKTNYMTGTTIVTNIEPFIVLLITGLIILLTSSILIIKAIKKLNPIEILQNE